MSKPFEGLKVLDLTTFVAAPCVCRLLADLGAEVIKVERNSGDGWRQTGVSYCPNEFSLDENPVYDYYNAGKKHISLNLKAPEGKEIFDKLMDSADIFVTNTRLGGLKRLGIDYDSLKASHPRLIYAMVEGFGEKGEDANTAAFDTTAFWARCGMVKDLAVVGDDESYQPIYPPSSVGDTVTAFLLLSEINAALYQREKTGEGQLVKVGLFRTGIFTFGTMQAVTQRPFGKVYPMKRWQHSTLAGAQKCKDGQYLYVATGVAQDTFLKLMDAIGRPELKEDPRFNSDQARRTNNKELYEILASAFITKPRAEWMEICKGVDLAVGVVNGFADVSEDPQALANGYIEEVKFRSGKTLKMSASPIDMGTLEGEDMSIKTAPPVGNDNDEVLKSLGYTDEQIKELYDKGVTKPTI